MSPQSAGSGAIQDLDTVVDALPTWRRRWTAPLAGALVLAAVLAVTFVKVPTLRPTALGGPPPAVGFRVLEVPVGVATFQTRVALSGITGLTQVSQNDGYRYLYRLADGRSLIFLEYPIRENGITLDRISTLPDYTEQRVTIRGVPALLQLPTDAAGSTAAGLLIWIADSTFYQLSTPATGVSELTRLAAALR